MLRALTAHWEVKLLSLVIAFALWMFVVGGERVRVALGAPVEYIGLPENLVLVESRDGVDIEVEAARWASPRVSASALRVRVDLSRAREGESIVQLSPALVQAPPGVVVTRITPAWVGVTVAPAVTKTVQVVPQIRGTPAPLHAMRRVVVQPTTVQIRGPRSTIETRGAVETLPVDVSGSRETVTQTVGLVAPESVSLIRDRTVQVTIEIEPEDSMRRGDVKDGRR